MAYFCEPVETMSRRDLETLQLEKLKSFLNAVYQKNPFYRDKFDAAGLKVERIRSLADFQELVPFSDKKEFLKDQDEFPVYGRRLGVPLSEIAEFHLSTGTSGLGQEVYAFTAADVEYNGTGMTTHFVWAGIEQGDSVACTLPVSIQGAPFSFMSGIRKLGGKPFMIGTLDSVKRLEIMHRFDINYFIATPVYLTRLMVTLEEMDIDPKSYLPALKTVGLSAGSYPLEWAQKAEEIWGVKFSEFYACASAGAVVAATCEKGIFSDSQRQGRGLLHFFDWNFIAEVLNPETLQPVEAGEEGELVITTLDKVASPVVRFRTGDKVRFFSHDHCTCGRPCNTMECGSIARFDDMIKVKAVNIWPQALDGVLFSYPEIQEFNAKVIVDDKGREAVQVFIEFKQEVGEQRIEELLPLMASRLKQTTGIHMQTFKAKPGEVEHFDFKPKRLKDERQQSLAGYRR